MAQSKVISRTWSPSASRALVMSTRCARNMLLLSRIVFPSSVTVARVSRPSKTKVIKESSGTDGFWKTLRYVQDFSLTHLASSSLNPWNGSWSLIEYKLSIWYLYVCNALTYCSLASPDGPRMELWTLASKRVRNHPRCL